MISSHLSPVPTGMPEVWENLISDLVLIKDGMGNFWMPSTTGASLTNWNVLNGYQVYMSTGCTLTIAGTLVESATTTITFPSAGWYLISTYH